MSDIHSTSCGCGCCKGIDAVSQPMNRPGLPQISYRIGTYSQLLERMRAQLASPSLLTSPPATGGWALSSLTTRSADDPAIALLDAWAVVLEVLSFYQERIANEGFLRSATERQSILELARAIGYELNPGVAASTFLSFLVEDVIGTSGSVPTPQTPRTPSAPTQGGPTYNAGTVLLDTGTQVQSVPPQGQLPQTFETAVPLQARTAWNLMLPRMTRFADLALNESGQLVMIDSRSSFPSNAGASQLTGAQCYLLNPSTPFVSSSGVNAVPVDHLYISGTNTGIDVGDLVMLVGVNSTGDVITAFMQARSVLVDSTSGRTLINFDDSPRDVGFAMKSFPFASIPGTPQPLNQQTVGKFILNASITESDLQALVRISNWDTGSLSLMVNSDPANPAPGAEGAYSFDSKASFFGHNAPLWSSLPDPSKSQRSDPYPVNWDSLHSGNGPYLTQNSQGRLNSGADVYLERSFPVIAGSLAAIEPSTGSLLGLEILKVADKSLADYSLSGKSTGLTLRRIDGAPILRLSAPTIAVLPTGAVVAFAVANGNIYQTRASNAATGEPRLRGSSGYASVPAVTTDGSVQVYAVDQSNRLVTFGQQANTSAAWASPVYLGQSYSGTPAVCTAPPGTPFSNAVDVFVRSTGGALVHFWKNGNTWTGPEYLTGNDIAAGTSPVAVGRGPSTLEVFYLDSTGVLMHKGKSNADPWWGPVKVLPTQAISFAGTPSVSLLGPTLRPGENNIDVFVHGVNGHLYHAWYLTSSGWHGPEDLGIGPNNISYINSPSLVEDGPSPLEVFSVGSDGNLYHRWWSAGTWFGPSLLGGNGQLVGSPSAKAIGQWGIEVAVSSIDGTVYLFAYNGGWRDGVVLGGGIEYYTRSSTLHFDSRQQVFAEPPITDHLVAGSTSIMLNGFVPGLTVGQAIGISGERPQDDAADVTSSEIVLLKGIAHHGGFTELQIADPGLQHSYVRKTVTLNANTVPATNGATIPVTEILGSGNATKANQSFVLSRTALTYVPASTPSGSLSTLTIRVNGLLWTEVESLYGLGPSDRCYVTQQDDDHKVTITFGDGIAGARLPSGQNNVSATYRTGIGVAGNVAAGTLSVLQSRPPGLRSVNNLLPASGGADPQELKDARTNAPRTVLTLDRVVSKSDFENFAATFAGIGKAQAIVLPLSSTDFQVIHITIAGGQGALVDPASELFTSLQQAIDAVRDPGPYVHISCYQPSLFNLSASLILDPVYLASDVMASAVSAVTDYFSFAKRDFAQPALAAEAITVLHGVAGVVAVELNGFFRTDAPPLSSADQVIQILPARSAGLPAGSSQGTAASVFKSVLPAELLLLNPIGLKLTEKKV